MLQVNKLLFLLQLLSVGENDTFNRVDCLYLTTAFDRILSNINSIQLDVLKKSVKPVSCCPMNYGIEGLDVKVTDHQFVC